MPDANLDQAAQWLLRRRYAPLVARAVERVKKLSNAGADAAVVFNRFPRMIRDLAAKLAAELSPIADLRVDEGMERARRLLIDVNQLGLPAGTEALSGAEIAE